MRVLFALLLLSPLVLADDMSDRAKLTGTWQLQEGSGDHPSTWTLEQNGDVIRITYSQNGGRGSEFQCHTGGKECEVNDSGQKAKISLWFNGSKLVELETKGSEIVKRTFAVAAQNDAMEVSVIPVVPAGKTELRRFHRAELATAGQR